MIAVAECARNITCSGGTPVAITNCLNFGNPYNPEVYWQFVHALKGMGEACLKFDTPVTGGNVSFYNQTQSHGKTEPVYPTPTIGMLGILDDASLMTTLEFKQEGHLIYLLGHQNNHIGYSEYVNIIHGIAYCPAPYFNLEEEYRLHNTIRTCIVNQWVASAHDVSEGGIFVSLTESAMASQLGFNIDTVSSIRNDLFLFGESQGRAIITIVPENKNAFETFVANQKVDCHHLGRVEGSDLVINGTSFGDLSYYSEHYMNAIGNKMEE
jgi:phosphoribosylformylglycinamidine synthase